MKKIISMVLVCVFLLLTVGCNTLSVKETPLLKKGNVTEIHISTYPGSYELTLTDREEIEKVVEYFSDLTLTSEDLEVPFGMSRVVLFKYDDGTECRVLHIGNYLRNEEGETYSISIDEAIRFDEIWEELIK